MISKQKPLVFRAKYVMAITPKIYHIQTAKILLDHIQKSTYNDPWFVFYKEIGDITGRDYHTQVGNDVGDLSYLCHCNSMPMISTIVVNQETLKPGTGFYDLWRDLYISDDKIDDVYIFIKELKAVFSYKEWYKLNEMLGI